MKLSAAIDVGKDGAIVILDNKDIILKSVIPIIGNQIDIPEIRNILSAYKGNNIHVVVEDVHAIFGASAKATFNFGWSLGIVEGVLSGIGIAYTKVAPKVWQKEMWQGIPPIYKAGKKAVDTKATSLLAAKRLFPNVDFRKSDRASLPHDGIVDALLMAEYGKRKF